jgi:MFS family permease
MIWRSKPQADASGHAAPGRRAASWPRLTTSRIYYGWILLVALSLAQVTSWGVLYYSFSVFVTPMSADLGWSRAALTGAFSLALLCSAVVGLGVGRWVDRHGQRLLMTAGSCLAALLVLAWARVGSLSFFYLTWVGLGVAMAATLYEPVFAMVATWFVRYRNRALTVLTFVAGFASVVYIPLTAWLVRTYGWRTALVILAILIAVLTIPTHALLLRRRPEDLGLLPDGAPAAAPTADGAAPGEAEVGIAAAVAVRGASFRWLSLGFCLAFFTNVAVTVHLIPYLIDHGFSSGFAASAAGLIGTLALPGRLVFTPLGGRIPRRFVAAAIFAVQALGLLVLVTTHAAVGVIAFVALFGLGFGAITPARAALVADLYGRTNFGSINGVLALFVTGARALAPVTAGLLYSAFGRYEPVFWLLIVTSIGAAGAVLMIDREQPNTPFVPQRLR